MGWDRIHGHDAPRRQLLSAYHRGRLAHAHLFIGPDGIGKRLFAVEFAKALLCEAPPAELTACDLCPACVQVEAGTHPDFVTVRRPDDKLELPVEVIRELCATLSLRPIRGGRKIAVVEDADDFNAESANSFLKTLEEPPPGAVLILLAASAERQLPTILSRCQVLRFQPLSAADLKRVLHDHGTTDPATAERLVRLSGGSAARAIAFADDAVWQFRQSLVSLLAQPRPDAVTLAARFTEFVEDAGKESAAQRQRASLVIHLITELLQGALRLALGADVPGTDPAEAARLKPFAEVVGADALAEMLEACVEADQFIDRRVQLVLMIEQLADRLSRR